MVEKRVDEMLDWAEHYLKHRDLILRKIDSFEKKVDSIFVKYKDGSDEVLIPYPNLGELKSEDIKDNTTIVTYNTENNFKALLDGWKQFAEIKNIKLIFFNPKSETEKRWVIKPYIHNRICDEKSLKQGLKAMFDTVETLV